jgi:hypothetical protein
MNHLHQVLDDFAAGRIYNPREFPQRQVESALSIFAQQAPKAIVFDCGDAEDLSQFKVIESLCRLPYQVCWFEATIPFRGQDRRALAGALCSGDGDGFVGIQVFRKFEGLWVLAGVLTGEAWVGPGEMKYFGARDEHTVSVCQAMVSCIQRFLSALHCRNVIRVEERPDAKLTKARTRRGKHPLFSTWTLHLDLAHEETVRDEGPGHGDRAPPRIHLVRGHPRQYAAGEWCWVRAHARGNRAAGVVHKDYKA